jgi:hypothetical protein
MASGSFTVTVTPVSLCKLTRQFVDSSAKYQRSTATQKVVLDKTVDRCARRAWPGSGLPPSRSRRRCW